MTAQAVHVFAGFQAAAAGLRRLLPVKTSAALCHLYSLRFGLRCGSILATVDPEKYRQVVAGRDFRPDNAYDQTFEHSMISALMDIAPFDQDMMEMDSMDGDGPDNIALWPLSAGFPMGWDDWEEVFDELGQQDPAMWMYLLFTSLRMSEPEKFVRLCHAYHWDADYPRANDQKGYELDWNRMYQLLDQEGLSEFKTAWDVCVYSTGNIYFDWNPYDEGRYDDFGVFDVDGFRTLAGEWERAQPIRDTFMQAQTRFLNDADLPARLVDVYRRSLVKSEERPAGGMTIQIKKLSEIWTEAAQTDPADIEQPFGPFDDDEAEDDDDDGYLFTY